MTAQPSNPLPPRHTRTVRSYPISALQDQLEGATLERDIPLAPFTTFQIGGPADLFVRAHSPVQLVAAISTARQFGIPYFLLGRGANILVADEGFRGLVVHCCVSDVSFVDEVRVEAGAGVQTFHHLIQMTVSRGLGGLHHFVGIPSTVGGALWQNLHFLSPAPDRERTVFIEEILESAEIFTEEGDLRTVGVDYFKFGYDQSILHHRDDVVLSATFRLKPTPEEELRRVMRENLSWRAERHPDLSLYPCVGSVFQKVEGIGAGRLIDECGLKGHVEGRAGIFHKHANIIVNLGGATAHEVCHLIDLARETVRRETGHELVPEITFVGDFGDP